NAEDLPHRCRVSGLFLARPSNRFGDHVGSGAPELDAEGNPGTPPDGIRCCAPDWLAHRHAARAHLARPGRSTIATIPTDFSVPRGVVCRLRCSAKYLDVF